MAQFIICPNPQCSYHGAGRKVGGANGCLVIILLFLGIIPGILYLLLCEKSGVACPRCGMRVR